MDTASGLSSSIITLESVKAQFLRWRMTRTKSERIIPDELWNSVKQLTKKYKYSQIASALGLNMHQLRSRFGSAANAEPPVSGSPNFVEVPLTPLSSLPRTFGEGSYPSSTCIEFSRPDGAALKASGLLPKDLFLLVERFLGR